MEKSRELADTGSKIGMKMLQHINQALAARDPQLVMSHVREAMRDGEELMPVIDDMIEYSVEGSTINEKAGLASDHLRESLTDGGAAQTASEDFIKVRVQSMKKHADEMMANLNAAALPIGR